MRANNTPLILLLFVFLFLPTLINADDTDPGEGEGEAKGYSVGELVMLSFKHSFPERTGETAFTDGDWTIVAENKTYHWAGGRLLPSSLLGEKENWEAHDFTPYPRHTPSPGRYTSAEIEKLRAEGETESRDLSERFNFDLPAALYGGSTRREAEEELEKIVFLGFQISVHRDIAEALKRIDSQMKALAKDDRETRDFISSIRSIEGYNWRQIRGSRKISYHSWGMAVDILPRELGNKTIYWLWEQAFNDEWMLVPLSRRWQPPEQLIRLFENEGFVWGGKWDFYDNMHFEFRPELHELNRLIKAKMEAGSDTNSAPGPDLHHIAPMGLPLLKKQGNIRD